MSSNVIDPKAKQPSMLFAYPQKPNPYLTAMQQESQYVTEKVVYAHRDKAYYDNPLGMLFELWVQENYIAPKHAQHCAHSMEFKPPEGDMYQDHLRAMYNNDQAIFTTPSPK